jgi:pyruvate dehydrogenase E2 component (dihydrolipoamide acetyltransferase)
MEAPVAYKLELPDIGEGVVEAEVQRWLVKVGDLVEEDQPLVEVMTDKATVVIPSPKRGRVLRLLRAEGELAPVHAPLVELETDEGQATAVPVPAAVAPQRPAPAARAAGGGASAEARKALATPAVRALARELGVALEEIAGTGPGGRVTKEDLAAARSGAPRNGDGAPGARNVSVEALGGSHPVPVEVKGGGAAEAPGGDERIPLRGVRRKIAENMARSKRTAAHFTFVEQCDATELVRARDRMGEAAKADGVKLTFLPFILKAAVEALRRFPRLNATMDEERSELVVHRRYDLGIAASTEAGLVVPVVRDVDRRSLLDLAREIERVAAAAKEGRLAPQDVGRSTFTVTSLGALGGLFATPVLNHPGGRDPRHPPDPAHPGRPRRRGGGPGRDARLGHERSPGHRRPRGGGVRGRDRPPPRGARAPLHAAGVGSAPRSRRRPAARPGRLHCPAR